MILPLSDGTDSEQLEELKKFLRVTVLEQVNVVVSERNAVVRVRTLARGFSVSATEVTCTRMLGQPVHRPLVSCPVRPSAGTSSIVSVVHIATAVHSDAKETTYRQ